MSWDCFSTEQINEDFPTSMLVVGIEMKDTFYEMLLKHGWVPGQ